MDSRTQSQLRLGVSGLVGPHGGADGRRGCPRLSFSHHLPSVATAGRYRLRRLSGTLPTFKCENRDATRRRARRASAARSRRAARRLISKWAIRQRICSETLVVALAPGRAAVEVAREVVAGEGCWLPGGVGLGRLGAGVGKGRSLASEGEAGEGVDVGLEGVEGAPFAGGEVGEDLAGRGGGRVGDEAGVEAAGEGNDLPSWRGSGLAGGVAVDEDAEDVREEEASVDEEGRRVRRMWGQSARGW